MTKFPDLEQEDAQLARLLEQIFQVAKELGAANGARRLEVVGSHFANLSLEQIYAVIDPAAILKEAEAAQTKKIHSWYLFRNGMALFPLILTWSALCLAAIDYQQDVAKYPDDVYQPFLKLWQEGFHATSWLTFSCTAFIDVCLLLLYLIFVWVLPFIERRMREKVSIFAMDLQDVTRGLMIVVAKKGPRSMFSNNDISKLENALKRVVDRALLSSQQLAEEAKTFVGASKQQVQTILDGFHQDLATFNADVLQLTQDLGSLGTNLQSYDQKLLDLTSASTQLAGSSSTLANNAQMMAHSATKSAEASQDAMQASQSISAQLNALNSSQQQIVSEIATAQQQLLKDFASTQRQISGCFDNAADKMEEVAKDTKLVARDLGQLTQADIQRVTNEIARLSRDTQMAIQKITLDVNNLGRNLDQVNRQLLATTAELNQAASSFARASASTTKKKFKLF